MEAKRRGSPVLIYYPICGGGEECLSVCPKKDEIWQIVPMRTSLFGIREKIRLRPVMVRPEGCLRCFLCSEACPTGAIFVEEVKHPWLRFVFSIFKLPFKRRYNLKFVLRKEHVEKFKANNFL